MPEIPEADPFRIALVGDFSGRNQPPGKPIFIDRDNFDDVMEQLQVTAGPVRIRTLDDFHPDALYQTSTFQELRERRQDLNNPETFAEAAGDKPAAQFVPPSGNLLDFIVGETATAAQPAPAEGGDLQDFIDSVMRPHLEAKQDPRAAGLIRQVEDRASEAMRAILHDSKFKSIESAWRATYQLVRRLDTGTDLKVYLIDSSKEQLAANLESFYQTMMQSGPWAVIAGNYSFGTTDLTLLGLLGRIGSRANAPFVGEADASLLGDPNWQAFRSTPEAAHVSLAIPRVLLRLPYGAETSPCDSFGFEEIAAGVPDSKHLLFGSAAFYVAMLLGQAFEQHGWDLRPGIVRDISGLPVYAYEEDGEAKALPCAEVELNEDTAEALIDEGLMPIAAVRNSDVARVVRFQSAAPGKALHGRWN